MKKRMLCLILALLLLPFGASASEEPQAVRTDYTYFYMTVSITDETTGEYYGTTLEGDTIPGDEKSPEAMAIRQDLIRRADAYAENLLRPGTELADRATSADLKWSYTNTYTVEDEAGGRTDHEDVYSSYYMIYSASIVSDGSVRIDAVNISVDSGSLTVGGSIDPAFIHPTAAALDADALYAFDRCAWTTAADRDAAPFSGAVRADTDYYAMIRLTAKDRAAFSENVTILANGEAPAEVVRIDDRTILVFVKYHVADSPVDDPDQWDDDPDPSERNPFLDVPEDSYYSEPVCWAVEKGVTTGTSATLFSPDKGCTRAQVVTFLWRTAGEPEPTSNKNPFADVKVGQYYYKAVLWAIEKGITTGTSATTFRPDTTCTRAQVVTFLWRYSGKPTSRSQKSFFIDVQDESLYCYHPVIWAVENTITTGTSSEKFSPDNTCTRAQIVTFLYRAMLERNPHEHKYDVKSFSATCLVHGYTKHTCSLCGYNYTDQYTAKTAISLPPQIKFRRLVQQAAVSHIPVLFVDTLTRRTPAHLDTVSISLGQLHQQLHLKAMTFILVLAAVQLKSGMINQKLHPQPISLTRILVCSIVKNVQA